MMKISKPVFTNEFMLSPVQFTSLNSIVFKNVKNIYDGNEKISLEYERSPKIEASSRDWIGIFPRGWSTLQQYLTFEWVSQSLPSGNSEQNKENGDMIRRTINFYLKYHLASVNNNSFYQFVYVSKQIEVLGVSSYFRFDLTGTTNSGVELECLVPISNKIRSTSVSDFGTLLPNNMSTTSIGTRTLQTTSIHSLQNLDVEDKNWQKAKIPLNITEIKKTAIFSTKTQISAGTGDALDPITSHSEPVFPMSLQMSHCKKCFHFKKFGEFLRSQQLLQSKLKIVMERNKILEERAQEMKKEMEKIQTESKKLKMSYHNVNKEKVACEKFVKDFIKSLEKDSIVRVVNGNTEILVKKVNYVGMEEHPRDKKTSKRERELKAVIGLQEITIRNLINSLQEKAKSVQELNQTVKLAQAFSEAREEHRECGSDAEESSDEASNPDVTCEYAFSLSKPSPPEEVTVEDADDVLEDIRKTTEMELKDIGINRSLGKSSSRDSMTNLGLPNLSVHSYQDQNEGGKPKKPKLFDNVEDCWPFTESPHTTVQRKVIKSSLKIDDNINENNTQNESQSNKTKDEIVPNDQVQESEDDKVEYIEASETENDKNTINTDLDLDSSNTEDYYDAYEAFSPKELIDSIESGDNFKTQQVAVFQDKGLDDKKQKTNFLVTAIIPQDLDIKPPKVSGSWVRVDRDSVEKEMEPIPEKRKKFTCELSIDFGAKKFQSQKPLEMAHPALENGNSEESQNQISNTFYPSLSFFPIKREDSLLGCKSSNKRLEIKITHPGQKENLSKSYIQQKMVVKFAKEPSGVVTTNTSKFELNLALGVGDNTNITRNGSNNSQNLDNANIEHSAIPELKCQETEKLVNQEDVSPRTVWNDAVNDIEDAGSVLEPEPEVVDVISRPGTPENIMEKQIETTEVSTEKSSGSISDTKGFQDSVRYEKNLEFLQQKYEEKKKEEEEVGKDKPTAILIQNGQTKLALIRYQ